MEDLKRDLIIATVISLAGIMIGWVLSKELSEAMEQDARFTQSINNNYTTPAQRANFNK